MSLLHTKTAPEAEPFAAGEGIKTPFSGKLGVDLWAIQGYAIVLFTFLCFFPRFSHIAEYGFLPLVAIGLGAAWWERRKLLLSTPIDLPLVLFVAWVLVSVPFAIDPAYSFHEWRKLITKVLVFYWVYRVLVVQPPDGLRGSIVKAVQLGTAILAVYAIAEFAVRGGGWEDRYVRAGAPSSDYNWLSTYMVMVIPLLLLMSVVQRERWGRLAGAGAFALALLAEAFSYTRAGWLGLITEGLALGIFTGRRVVLAWVLGVFLLIGGTFFAVSQLGYQRSTVDPWTFNARVAIWKLEMNEILTHPFVGIGYGGNTFMMRFADYPETRQANGPHSTFLMVAMGSGLPAFAFLVWLFVRIIKVLVSQASRIPNRERAAVSLAVAVMIVGFVTRNVFDYMFAGSLAYLFWILVALGLSQEASDIPATRRTAELPARMLSNR